MALPPLRWTMERCLAKDPSQRYDSTRNLYCNLQALRDHYSEAYASTVVEPLRNEARKRGGVWTWIAIPACLLAAAAFGVLATQKVGVDLSRNRYTPFAMMSEPQTRPLWSPDGKAVAWMGTVGGHGELFARYLNSPVATQLTHVDDAEIVRWSPDGKRVLFLATESNVGKAGPARGRYSIALIGGEPERLCSLPVEAFQIAAVDVSPDLKTMAIIARRGNGGRTVFLASPLGSEFREYQPDPFSSATFFGRPQLRFSPDGSKLLLVRTGDSPSEEAWLLTVPQGNPRRVVTHLPASHVTDDVSWLSDNRHVAIALRNVGPNVQTHIWIADTMSDDAYQVTGGTGAQPTADISPDSRRIVYSELQNDLDIVDLPLTGGKPTKLISTNSRERMAAWSANTPNWRT